MWRGKAASARTGSEELYACTHWFQPGLRALSTGKAAVASCAATVIQHLISSTCRFAPFARADEKRSVVFAGGSCRARNRHHQLCIGRPWQDRPVSHETRYRLHVRRGTHGSVAAVVGG